MRTAVWRKRRFIEGGFLPLFLFFFLFDNWDGALQ